MALLGAASAEPVLTKEQALKLGKIVLKARENAKYQDAFANLQSAYDEKKQLWVFSGTFPVTPDGPVYIFELREKDGYYRLGWITPWKSSPGYDQFRIAPSIKKKVSQWLSESKPPKQK